VAVDDRTAFHAAQPILDASSGMGRHSVGAPLHPGYIDAERRVEHDSVIGAASSDMDGIGTGDERLRPCTRC
jgi:hypothetical protein